MGDLVQFPIHVPEPLRVHVVNDTGTTVTLYCNEVVHAFAMNATRCQCGKERLPHDR